MKLATFKYTLIDCTSRSQQLHEGAIEEATNEHFISTRDFTAIKRYQQQAWASDDYSMIAAILVPISERLCEVVDLQAGQRILDVATGSGNTALSAARYGCDVIGIDFVLALLGTETGAGGR